MQIPGAMTFELILNPTPSEMLFISSLSAVALIDSRVGVESLHLEGPLYIVWEKEIITICFYINLYLSLK